TGVEVRHDLHRGESAVVVELEPGRVGRRVEDVVEIVVELQAARLAVVHDGGGKVGGNLFAQPDLAGARVFDPRAVVGDDGRIEFQLLGEAQGRGVHPP